eukprot:scaffold171_cov263-Pinguiococcus_pyrenoidosus.AAC.1
MAFQDVGTAAGLQKLNAHMLENSYVKGYGFSGDDEQTFSAVQGNDANSVVMSALSPALHTYAERPGCHTGLPDPTTYPHAARWFLHCAALMGVKVLSASAAAAPAAKAAPAAAKDDGMLRILLWRMPRKRLQWARQRARGEG